MKYSTSLHLALTTIAAVMLLQHGTVVWASNEASRASDEAAPMVGSRSSLEALTPQPPSGAMDDESDSADADRADDPQGDVATLTRLIRDDRLSELRETHNGGYGASLFFYPPDMTYYVVLFQGEHFWRVIRSQDEARAESVYADFSRQTRRLGDVEIRRVQLQAQKASVERTIAVSEEHARRLQSDLDVARTQRAKADDRQRRLKGEALALRAGKARAQLQLRDVQRRVRELQREAEAGLPGAGSN